MVANFSSIGVSRVFVVVVCWLEFFRFGGRVFILV